MFVYVYQTRTFPPHYGDNVKVKNTAHLPGYPALLSIGEAVVQMTGSLFIAYDVLHMKI